MCNNTINKDPTTPQVCRYTTLWNVSVLEATIEDKTIYVTTHFILGHKQQKTTCLLPQLLSKANVTWCSFYARKQVLL